MGQDFVLTSIHPSGWRDAMRDVGTMIVVSSSVIAAGPDTDEPGTIALRNTTLAFWNLAVTGSNNFRLPMDGAAIPAET